MAKVHPLPKHIDDPKMLLLWSVDEVVPIVTMLCIGILIGQAFLFFIGGLALARLYRRYMDNQPDGHLFHLLYWAGLFPESARAIPSPFRKTWIG